MTPEDILDNHGIRIDNMDDSYQDKLLKAMKEYGDLRFAEGRDKAIDWVVANLKYEYTGKDSWGDDTWNTVDIDSILSAKQHPDLAI